MTDVQPWRETLSWNASRAGGRRALAPDEQARRRIARLSTSRASTASRRS